MDGGLHLFCTQGIRMTDTMTFEDWVGDVFTLQQECEDLFNTPVHVQIHEWKDDYIKLTIRIPRVVMAFLLPAWDHVISNATPDRMDGDYFIYTEYISNFLTTRTLLYDLCRLPESNPTRVVPAQVAAKIITCIDLFWD